MQITKFLLLLGAKEIKSLNLNPNNNLKNETTRT